MINDQMIAGILIVTDQEWNGWDEYVSRTDSDKAPEHLFTPVSNYNGKTAKLLLK